jgi:hypothetical protein
VLLHAQVEVMFCEVQQDYVSAIAQSMVDYELRDATSTSTSAAAAGLGIDAAALRTEGQDYCSDQYR